MGDRVTTHLQNARWRFSQIAKHHETGDAMAEPKLVETWAEDGFRSIERVIELLRVDN
jgi:hypothetical protein